MNYNTQEANADRTERRNGTCTITVGNSNTSLSEIDKAARQGVSKGVRELTINQQGLVDIYTHSSQ